MFSIQKKSLPSMGSQCTGRVKANVAQISGPVNLVGKQEALRVSRQRQKAKEENCTHRSKPTALVVRQKKFTQCVNQKNYWCIIYRRAKKTRCQTSNVMRKFVPNREFLMDFFNILSSSPAYFLAKTRIEHDCNTSRPSSSF